MTVKIVLKISTITPPTANLYHFTIAEERFQLLFAYFTPFFTILLRRFPFAGTDSGISLPRRGVPRCGEAHCISHSAPTGTVLRF